MNEFVIYSLERISKNSELEIFRIIIKSIFSSRLGIDAQFLPEQMFIRFLLEKPTIFSV